MDRSRGSNLQAGSHGIGGPAGAEMPGRKSYDILDYEDPDDRGRLVVEWMLSSVCNYACSYCPTHLHDGRVRWPDHEVAVAFCRRVVDHYRSRRVTFLFTGGEVTRYPRFIDLARAVGAHGAAVAVLSNASRPLAWWEKALPHLDEAILSFHVEFADSVSFGAVVDLLSARIPVQVNVVMVPSRFDECLQIAEAMEQRAPAVIVHRKPVLENGKCLSGEYDDRAYEVLRVANQAAQQAGRFPSRTLLKGDLLRCRADGRREVVTPIQLLLNDENHWHSWDCAIGVETLLVRWDEVYRGICRVGGLIGSIYDQEISFPDRGVICTERSCNCIGGIKTTKRRLPEGLPR